MAETEAKNHKMKAPDYITVDVPIYDRNEAPHIHVSINSKDYWVPRGKSLSLPRAVADIVKRKLRSELKATQAIKQLDSTDTRLY